VVAMSSNGLSKEAEYGLQRYTMLLKLRRDINDWEGLCAAIYIITTGVNLPSPMSAMRTNYHFEIGSMPYLRQANRRQFVP
jgi:hypothetical protein